ncbi:Kelch repeat-containing protein [Elizabethkingia meningoseptica]|uniref:Kelch repeat-containing protein n=1 Tax=Elizabethkingia meningoseptica TaxID=238 RepID=UPI001629A0B6|nr:hypothetical protein [Elizabethkingia meningoseptica]
MKKILFLVFATIILSCNNSDRSESSNNQSENKFILKSENLKFSNGENLPNDIKLPASVSNGSYITITNGIKNYYFDVLSFTWQKLENSFAINTELQGSNIIMTDTHFIIFNGLNTDNKYNEIWSSNPYSQNIQKPSYSFFSPSYKDASVACNYLYPNDVYMTGGLSSQGVFENGLYKIRIENGVLKSSSKIAFLPDVKEAQIELIENKIYVVGGDKGISGNRIDMYDIESKTWTFLGKTPYPISDYTTCMSKNKIWIVGNSFINGSQLSYYNIKTNEFVTVSNNLTFRKKPNAEIIDDRLFIFGGKAFDDNPLKSLEITNIIK